MYGLTALGRVLLIFMPGCVVLASLIAICIHTGTLWPWGVVVHEDGLRTLAETVFYFEHATRELPIDLLLSVAVAGSVLRFYPAVPPTSTARRRRARRMFFCFLVLAAAVVGVILLGAATQAGAQGVTANLTQMYTREGAVPRAGCSLALSPVEPVGSHVVLLHPSRIQPLSFEPRSRTGPRGSAKVFLIAVVALFAPGVFWGYTAEPLVSPVYLGHQARELVTHTLVTVPWALGVCLWLQQRVVAETGESRSRRNACDLRVAAGSAVLIYGYLVAGALITGAQTEAQTDSLVRLVAVHFLEHSLTYVVTPLVAGSIYLWWVSQASLKRKQGTA